MAITPDRKKSAAVGVGLSLLGLVVLMYGTFLLPLPEGRSLFAGLLLIIFGILLTVSAVLIFVIPAIFDYLEAATE